MKLGRVLNLVHRRTRQVHYRAIIREAYKYNVHLNGPYHNKFMHQMLQCVGILYAWMVKKLKSSEMDSCLWVDELGQEY